MRYALLLAALPALFAADLKIDHATVAGTGVRKMQADLQALGIATVYGGAHSNHATEMALVSFPDGSYLEVMGIQPGADPKRVDAHEWAAALKGDAGPVAWAVRVRDIAAEVKRLQAAGVKVSGPETAGRQRPDGVKLEWQTSSVGSETRGSFFPFLIQDLTKRDQRVYPQGKPVTRDFKGVTRVVIAVRSLEDAIKRYRAAYGLPAAIKQVDQAFGAQLALVGDAPVILAQPLGSDSWLGPRIDRFGEGPCAFVLGSARPGKYSAASKSRWFGVDISWFDPGKLGWRLGFEAAN
jgi:catechol 2,3-dioxygenase-like lactoylglutathione lyase family enzyme